MLLIFIDCGYDFNKMNPTYTLFSYEDFQFIVMWFTDIVLIFQLLLTKYEGSHINKNGSIFTTFPEIVIFQHIL